MKLLGTITILSVLSLLWALGAICCVRSPAMASPWVEVGDQVLRSDVEILAAYGLIAPMLTTWPIPWAQVSHQLLPKLFIPRDPLGNQLPDAVASRPPHVWRSLDRVRARLAEETAINRFRESSVIRVTNEPALVRGFGTSARDEIDARFRVEYMGRSTAARLAVGNQGEAGFDNGKIALDDSYFAQGVGNWLLYGGVVDHWWGPGWVSSLILSNNARPFPRVGIMRNNPKAFEALWLSWIGPWQLNAFVGVLDEDGRVVSNPIVLGFRLTANPLAGLELGASRTIMICGRDRPCTLKTLGQVRIGQGRESGDDFANEVASLDALFASSLDGQHFTLYGQLGFEDEARLRPSFIGGLFGLSLWGGIRDDGALWRLTAEYSDSTAGFYKGDPDFNAFYNHTLYRSGYRYRERSIGHSLDGDSRLFSLVATLTDIHDWTYSLAYHHAELNRDGGGRQLVSTSAEDVNLAEAALIIPWRRGTFEVELRAQDDQPNTPGEIDFQASVEASWTIRF